MDVIVVGCDGSAGARSALEFAAREAAVHSARLRVVCAWQTPYGALVGGFVPPPDFRETLERGADETARRAAEIASQLEPSIYVEHEAIEGYPAEVLVDEAREAALVVVGSRGHGGFASMLLGSVSHEVAQHASCPVVIVPKVLTEELIVSEERARARA